MWCAYITVCPTYLRSMAFVCYSLNSVCVKEVHNFQHKINIKKNSKPFSKLIICLAFYFPNQTYFICFEALKGLSHEIDFKNCDENLQNLA